MPRSKRLAEIMLRKKEIKDEITSGLTTERMAELNTEVDALITEENQIRSEMNLANRLGSPEHSGNGTETEAEKRGKALREKRAVTVSSGTLATPTDTQIYVNDMLGSGNSIADKVKFSNCYGMSEHKVPYVVSEATAAKTVEGSDAGGAEPVFAYATLKPVTLTTYSEISSETMKLTDTDYYSKVQESARKALRHKISEYIINSDKTSSPDFLGINKAAAIDADSDVSINAIDDKTLRAIALNYGGDEDVIGEGILILNKKDLVAFGDVRGTDKKPVYEIIPDTANTNTGIIKDGGFSVRYSLSSNIKDLTAATAGDYIMYYGVPTCFEIGLFSDFTVKVSEDAAFKKRMIAVLGEVMAGGNVVVKNGFVRVKKASAASA